MWQLMRRVAGNMCQRQCTLTYIQSEAFLNHMGKEKVAFWIRFYFNLFINFVFAHLISGAMGLLHFAFKAFEFKY